MKRRELLTTSAKAGAGLLILPSGLRAGPNAPSNKLNIAMIGTWGRANAHFGVASKENIVALCDVDEEHLAGPAKKYPKAKTYVDWRKCLEQKDIDAVICCTTDHTHAFIANWAMNRGMHVYMEKPLADSAEEARVVRATYLKNKDKLATQVGTQRHANGNFARIRELIKDGAIGELKEAHAWGNRRLGRKGYPPAAGDPPKHLHYDLWIGPAPFHPYNPEYFKGGSGANCLQWNMYWDFGTGQVGDMGSHTMDLVWNVIDAAHPTSAEAEGDPYNPEVTPVKLRATFENPANNWRPAIKVSWHQGGAMPEPPVEQAFRGIGHGALFTGSKGWLVSDFGSHAIIPKDAPRDTRVNRKGVKGGFHFQGEWINACKGDLKTSCDFDYGALLIEEMLLGLVAYRAGEKIAYDGKTGRIPDNSKAEAFLKKEYRKGWTLNG